MKHTNYTPNLGELCDDSGRRDAVHIAVAPVIAAVDLHPGWHVALDKDGRAVCRRDGAIGVVDPFLEKWVREGERCWIFLYPGTISSLRHVWQHPAFKPRLPEEKS